MGFYEQQVLPRVIDVVLGNRAMADLRRRAMVGLHGTIVEIGFGSGPNVPLYPEAVERVIAVDPAIVGRRLAADRLAASPVPVEFVGLDGQALPLDDAVADGVLSTWTLCTIPDVHRALLEVRRVLKPGARLHFLEHGLADDPNVARRQHRFTPVQRRVAGGCHLDRDIAALVRAAGLELDRCDTFAIAGPKTMSFMYAGTAHRPV